MDINFISEVGHLLGLNLGQETMWPDKPFFSENSNSNISHEAYGSNKPDFVVC